MTYLYHEEQIDDRPAACYLLTYRGVKYYSCYGITLRSWFLYLYERGVKPITDFK
jgi:hypothetical protein